MPSGWRHAVGVVAIAVSVALGLGPASANCTITPDLARVVRTGNAENTPLRLAPMLCSDVPDGIDCVSVGTSRVVEIDALTLGAATSPAAAERLLDCRNPSNDLGCLFAVTVTPTAVEASRILSKPSNGRVKLIAPGLDLKILDCRNGGRGVR